MKYLAALLLGLLLGGCASPLAPTATTPTSVDARTSALTWTPVDAPCNEALVEFRHWTAVVTNLSGCEHTYTLVIWDYRDDSDQRALAHHTMFLRPGETAVLSVGFPEECGRLYQRDVYMDLPPVGDGHFYTLSDVINAVFWSPGQLLEACSPPLAQVPPNGPPGPPAGSVCERAAFAQIDDMQVAGGVASITLRLRPGYDNVTVYLLAYASPTPFPIIGGRLSPTFPQTLVNQALFVIRAGPAQTISIPVPQNVTAYQIDAGCVPGPPTLFNRQTYPPWAFLEAALGNN